MQGSFACIALDGGRGGSSGLQSWLPVTFLLHPLSPRPSLGDAAGETLRSAGYKGAAGRGRGPWHSYGRARVPVCARLGGRWGRTTVPRLLKAVSTCVMLCMGSKPTLGFRRAFK